MQKVEDTLQHKDSLQPKRFRKRRDADYTEDEIQLGIDIQKLTKFVKEKANETFQTEINHLLKAMIMNFPPKDLCKRISKKCLQNLCPTQSKQVTSGDSNHGKESSTICLQGPPGPPGPRGERGLGLNEPKLIKSTPELSANITDKVTFEMLFFGSPIPKIQWDTHAHNTEVFETVDKENGYITAKLIVSNITWEDRGKIVCRATSLLGQVTAMVTLNVFSAPVISMEEGPVFVYQGVNYEFPACNVRAYPKAKITWSRVFWSLPEQRYSVEDNLLKINRVQYNDEGFYICKAENFLGKTDQKIQMKIKPIEAKIESSWDIQTGTGNISCSAYGNPEEMSMKISVVVDDAIEKELDTDVIRLESEIVLQDVLQDSGLYSCVVKSKSEEQQAFKRIDLLTLDSQILESNDDYYQLSDWLKESSALGNYSKCYDSFYPKGNFKSACGYKSQTLSLVKTRNGSVYGAYTGSQMVQRNRYQQSRKDFIFDMTERNKTNLMNYFRPSTCLSNLNCGPCLGPEFRVDSSGMYYYGYCNDWNRKLIFDSEFVGHISRLETFYHYQ